MTQSPYTALILAGGKASRLLPITAELPKCLLPVGNKTILGWQIAALTSCNVRDVTILSGMHAEQIQMYMATVHPEIHCTFIFNNRFAVTRPAHALYLARDLLASGAVLYLNGDVLFDSDTLSRVINDSHENATATRRDTWEDEQVNVRARNGLIVEIGKHIREEPSEEFVGITKISQAMGVRLNNILTSLPETLRDQMYAVDAIQCTVTEGAEIACVDVTDTRAIEIDTIEDYKRALATWEGTTTV